MKAQNLRSGSSKTPPRFRLIPETSDRSRYVSSGRCTPEHLAAVIAAADSGDIEQLCLVGREILDYNWDVGAAMEQRIDALTGSRWTVEPGGDTPPAKEAAQAFGTALKKAGRLNKNDTFYDFCVHAMDAVILPFSPAAIVWGEGGTLEGFRNLEPWNFTLRDGFTPRLITDEFPTGMPEELQTNGFVFHTPRKKGDPVRQGHIRALAWLHCFQNWPIKDLMSFIERFGMPFVVAKVDQNAWDNERSVLHQLIRNFGPSGGGVFTKSTELELLQAANTGGDNVYFRALEFTRNAIYTLIVGQLASSSDSSGMSNGDAQTAVRQDILEADARALEATILAQVSAPWTLFRFGPGVPPPELRFAVEPTENLGEFAIVVNTLSQAGFKADAAELSERFGIKLRYEPPAQPAPYGNALAMSDKSDKSDRSDKKELAAAAEEWLKPLADEVDKLADDDDMTDAEFGRRLAALAAGKCSGPTKKLEKFMEERIYDAIAGGAVKR